eukprot:1662832-Rhodomonas_salina.2
MSSRGAGASGSRRGLAEARERGEGRGRCQACCEAGGGRNAPQKCRIHGPRGGEAEALPR